MEFCNKTNTFSKILKNLKGKTKRLVFEELLTTQLALLQLKNNYTNNEKGIAFNKEVKISEFINTLPFKLTKAQLRVIEEIDNNMESDKPMNRLLQGDVGSGKTVVSMVAAYKAVKSRLSSSNYGANCYFSNTTFRKL